MIKQVLFNNKVEVGISEISDGNMRFFGDGNELDIIKNQKNLGKLINVDNIARIKTVYNERKVFTKYTKISKENLSNYSIDNPEETIPTSDGLVTKESEIGILLPLADCIGAVVYDEKQNTLGLLHAGRQNIEQNGPKKFIEYFVKNLGSNVNDLKIYFSPHALNYHINVSNKKLGEAAKEQFVSAGVLPNNISDPKIDTVSSNNFPSNSSGDTTKRFAVVVKLN